MASARTRGQGMTEYIVHHLHHAQIKVGEGWFWTINIDSVIGNQVTIREGLTTGERILLTPSTTNHLAAGDTSAGGA